MHTSTLPERRMGRGGIAQVKEIPKFRCELRSAVGGPVGQPQQSYFGPGYADRSPAGPWRERTAYLLFQLFPSYTKHQQHGIIYTFARV